MGQKFILIQVIQIVKDLINHGIQQNPDHSLLRQYFHFEIFWQHYPLSFDIEELKSLLLCIMKIVLCSTSCYSFYS